LAYAREYPNSNQTADAFIRAFNDEASLNDGDGAEHVFTAWSEWDPKNPDPLAVLARFYIDRKIKLDRSVDLLNQALVLFRASNPRATRSGSDRSIKARMFSLVAPFSDSNGRIEFLRGQAYLLLNRLPEAQADLEAAVTATPDKPEVQSAVGEVREKMGDAKAALEAYLAAASAPYNSTEEARSSYERLFVAQGLGSRKLADSKLFARIEENDRKLAAQYTPVALDRSAPEFLFHEMNGRRFDNKTAKGKPTVIDFWTVWCGACTLELPALQRFQSLHPEVNVLTVAIDEKPQEVNTFLAKNKLKSLRVAVTPEVPKELTSAAYPTTVVLDASGQIQFVHEGVLPDVSGILQRDLDALKPAH
jgi:thiol-disulfide isomerase/thioredoxin